jgi:hypothetical protein
MSLETKGEKKLRETKEEQVRLLAEEASLRFAELLSLSESKSQDKSTQTEWLDCSCSGSSVNLPE